MKRKLSGSDSYSTIAKSDMTAQEWKEKGNEEFNKNNWSEASSHYTNALKLLEDNAEKAVYYKCRAATYLKLHDYEKVVQDCDSANALLCCNEALYRRCQALEALERFKKAYPDAEIIISSDSNNKVIQPVATHLHEIVQERCSKNIKITAKVSQMQDDLSFKVSEDNEKREAAMNNSLVLARERAGAEEIFKKEDVSKIAQLVEAEKNEEVLCTAIRVIGELCQNNINQTEFVMEHVGLLWCLEMINSTSTERVNASQYCLQNILNTYSGTSKEPDSKPDKASCAAHKKEIDMILSFLLNSVTNRTITSLARDAIIQLITRNIHFVTDIESKVRTVLAITTLIFGQLDVAEAIICKDEVFKMILAMAEADDLLQQKVVCECIVAAMIKCNEINVFIWRGRNILQDLYYYSKHDSVRIRALVGLCILTKFKTRFCSPTIELFPHGATKKLAQICRRFLINPKNEKDMRKWAIKGLTYLTIDPWVKRELIEDQQAIQAMIVELMKTDDQSILYDVLKTLVNLCHAYVEREHIPEMMDLVRFAEHYFEGYNLIDEDAVKKRVNALAKAGVISDLVDLAKTDNRNCKELIARIFNAARRHCCRWRWMAQSRQRSRFH